jgi:hypothetical protein
LVFQQVGFFHLYKFPEQFLAWINLYQLGDHHYYQLCHKKSLVITQKLNVTHKSYYDERSE